MIDTDLRQKISLYSVWPASSNRWLRTRNKWLHQTNVKAMLVLTGRSTIWHQDIPTLPETSWLLHEEHTAGYTAVNDSQRCIDTGQQIDLRGHKFQQIRLLYW